MENLASSGFLRASGPKTNTVLVTLCHKITLRIPHHLHTIPCSSASSWRFRVCLVEVDVCHAILLALDFNLKCKIVILQSQTESIVRGIVWLESSPAASE